MHAENMTIEELEQLDWYDLISTFGLETFNWAGMESWDEMLDICQFPHDAKLLFIGCGPGTSALYVAEKYGFNVTGIDLAEKSLEKANQTAKEKKLSDRSTFIKADAHKLPFENGSFDGVFTEYMAYFLDHSISNGEFFRVLKKGGQLGFNELIRENVVPDAVLEKIHQAQMEFAEVSGYELKILSIDEYAQQTEKAGFQVKEHKKIASTPSVKDGIKMIGGWKNFFKMMKQMIRLTRKSEKIRRKFALQRNVKKIIMRDKKTAKYINPMLFVVLKE